MSRALCGVPGRSTGLIGTRIVSSESSSRISGVIVGLPRDLAGREALAAESVRRFVEGFQRAVAPVPVEFVDERMTTVSAARSLREAGKDSRKARWLIDQAAAVTILQGWLDSVR